MADVVAPRANGKEFSFVITFKYAILRPELPVATAINYNT
jgi:hypothetical protein